MEVTMGAMDTRLTFNEIIADQGKLSIERRAPRGSLQNRPMRVTSKPANEREAGQDLLYLAGGLAGNSFLRF
jgi:hypothetical protein